MIVLKLMGGLGNQMSQVAYSLALSKMYNESVYLDATSYENYKIRPFSVNKLQLSGRFILLDYKLSYGKKFHISQRVYESLHYHFGRKRALGKFVYRVLVLCGHYYSFDSLYYGIPKTRKKNKDIYGYFLSEKYFHENRRELVKMFDTKEEYLSDRCLEYARVIGNSICPVAISLRLQDDYANDPIMNVCTKEYYLKAIKIVEEKYQGVDFYIFSDDIERAKALDLGVEATYLDNITDVEGMYLLKRCSHYIISNSSFAWWGAYLGNNPQKMIIAPAHWMNDGKDYSSKYYDGVIRLD